jgi:hypothetical protein
MVFQAWAMLERDEGNVQLARELLKCAVKADPKSEPSWLVSKLAEWTARAAVGGVGWQAGCWRGGRG